jgi:hypothetical protein
MGNPIQDALNILTNKVIAPVGNNINTLINGQQYVSPLPQGQQLTPQQIYDQHFTQQMKSKGMMLGADGIWHGQINTPNKNNTQQAQTNTNPVQQATPTPSTTPTPTPFPNNPINGYVMSTPSKYQSIINKAAKQYNVPSSLISGLLNAESQWNPDVISGKIKSNAGALGIAQFMPDTAKGMGIDPLDPNQAIPAAAKKLRAGYDQFGQNSDLALAAYNAGAGNVQQYGGVPPFPETQRYITKIRADLQTLYDPQANK